VILATTVVALFAGMCLADDPIWTWTGVDAAPNYKPVGCTDGTLLPMDSVQATYLSGRYHADFSDGDVTVYANISANFDIHCQNGITAHLTYSHRIVDDLGLAFGGGDPYDLNFPNPGASWDTLKLVHLNPQRYTAWAIEIKGEPQTVISYIQLQQADNPGQFLPPLDTSNHRVLARPVLFVHGINSDASGWGAQYANRTCHQYNPQLIRWNVDAPTQSFSSSAPNFTLPGNTPSTPLTWVSENDATLGMVFQMGCEADTHHLIDSAQIGLVPVVRTWLSNQPWLGFYDRDNSPVYQFRDGAGNWTNFGSVLPNGTDTFQIRALVPRPGGLDAITSLWAASDPVDLTDSTSLWWNSMLAKIPTLSRAFSFQGGKVSALSTTWDTVSLSPRSGETQGWVPGFVSRSTWQVSPWAHFAGKTYTFLLPNTYSDVLVRSYTRSSGPDILARIERLENGYDSTNAQAGINRNGIYFYTSLNDAGDSLSPFQPPMWSPSSYGYNALRGQARQLFERMDTVLTHHYGSRAAWIHDSTKKIDIVCHSQGCLDTRDMIRNNPDASLANPLNHIRKVVSMDSPAFGSAFATSTADLGNGPFSSLGEVRTKLLDTAGELVTSKDLGLVGFHSITDAAYAEFDTCSGRSNSGGAFIEGTACAAVTAAGEALKNAAVGAVGAAVVGYNSCSNATWEPPGVSELLGVGCAGLLAPIGAVGANLSNFSWSLKGGLTGPYDLRLRANTVGITTIHHFQDPGPTSMRTQLFAFADTTRHLSQTSPWIGDLARFGYPGRPLDGAPVPFTVLFSGSTHHIVDEVAQQLRGNLSTYCEEHDDDITDNCDVLKTLVSGTLGTDQIADDPTVQQVENWAREFQYQWTDTGDIVVEKASQLMVNQSAGFTPKTGLFDTTAYRFQTAYGVGDGKYVAHMPITAVASFDANGSNMNFNVVRSGAALMGLDIQAALGLDTLAFSQGMQTLPRDGAAITLPSLSLVASARTIATIQQLLVQGDFDVEEISLDSLVQGISLSPNPTYHPSVLAFWDRNQGVYLYGLHQNGQPVVKVLSNGGRPVRVRLTRRGSTLIMTATGLDDLVNVDSIALPLPGPMWLGGISTPSVASVDSTRPMLVGHLTVTDSSALIADQPWKLRVLVREAATANQANLGNPRILLINKDTRTLQGATLYYEFRADPSRIPVLQSFQGPGNATLESLGGDRWRVRIIDPTAVVPPLGIYPSTNGFSFQLSYQDGSTWPRRGEWSSYSGSPQLYTTDRIQVRDGSGNILIGTEMPASDQGVREAALGLARDEAITSNNEVAPVIAVRNSGGVPLEGFHVQWFVRAPPGTTVALESWYTPDAKASIKAMGKGLWMIDLNFANHILYPAQTTAEQKIGINLSDWSAWDRSHNPTHTSNGQGLVPVEGMVVRDSSGNILWGNLPLLPDMVAVVIPPDTLAKGSLPVSVQIRDENPTDNTWLRPRMILTNLGSTTLTSFVVTYPLTVDTGKTVLVAPWYAPGCNVGIVSSGGPSDTIRYVCQNLSVQPGGIWPDQGGAVVGLQYSDWTLWNRSADPFVATWAVNFTPTTVVKVEALP
jgi:hypothetical protein